MIESSVAPTAPAGGSEASGGALTCVEDVGVELRFGGLPFEVHARPREIFPFIGLHGRAARGDAKSERQGELQGREEGFSARFSAVKWWARATRGVSKTRVVVRSHGYSAMISAAYGPTE